MALKVRIGEYDEWKNDNAITNAWLGVSVHHVMKEYADVIN